MTGPTPLDPLDSSRYDAILFDLDGVLTETAGTHRTAWKEMFDDFLAAREDSTGEDHGQFTTEDYLQHVDGRPRFEGVRAFLASRGITLPEGTPNDPPDADTVYGLGNRKNTAFNAIIDRAGVAPLPGSVRFVSAALAAGMRTAVVSSSANAGRVLEAAGIAGMFEVRIDGLVARELGLPGKPQPDMFLEAAGMLGTSPPRAVVVEDALAGVAAGRAGGFGLVVGIGPQTGAKALIAEGADVVVSGLGALLPD